MACDNYSELEDYCQILTNEYHGQIREGKGGLAKWRMMPRMAGRGREMRARCGCGSDLFCLESQLMLPASLLEPPSGETVAYEVA